MAKKIIRVKKRPPVQTSLSSTFLIRGNGSAKALSPTTKQFYSIDDGAIDFGDNPSGLREAYLASVWAMRCIRARAYALAKIPVVATHKGEHLSDDHSLNMALTRRASRLWRMTEIHLMVYGEAYWLWGIDPGGKVNIQAINPFTIEVMRDHTGIHSFKQTINGSTVNEWGPDNIIHFYEYDPYDDLAGKSPTSWVLQTIGLDLALERFAKVFFENDATPAGILTTDQRIMESDAERYKSIFTKEFAGVDNQHKVAMLGQGMKYEPISSAMKDLALSELDEKTKRRIAAAYGVPTTIALMDDSSNYSTSLEQRRSFYTETILPELDMLLDTINDSALVKKLGEKVEIVPLIDQIEALQEDRNAISSRASAAFQAGVRSMNETRELEGLPALPVDFFIIPEIGAISRTELEKGNFAKKEDAMMSLGGHEDDGTKIAEGFGELYVGCEVQPSSTLTILEQRIQEMFPEILKTEDKKHVTLLYAPSVSREKAEQFYRKVEQFLKSPGQITVGSLATFDNVGEHALHFKVRKNTQLQILQTQLWRMATVLGIACSPFSTPSSYKPHVTFAYLKERSKRTTFNGNYLLNLLPPKVEFNHKPLTPPRPFKSLDPEFALDEWPSKEEFDSYWDGWEEGTKELEGVAENVLKLLVPALVGELDGEGVEGDLTEKIIEQIAPSLIALHLGGQENGKRALKAVGIEPNWQIALTEAQDWAKLKANELVTNITQTTKDDLRKIVAEWSISGKPMSELVSEIRESLLQDSTTAAHPKASWLMSKERASLIAQTESTQAFHEGAKTKWKRNGVEKIRFRTQNDREVCPTCKGLNNKEAPIGGMFRAKDGKTYSIPVHPNCRCFAAPVRVKR